MCESIKMHPARPDKVYLFGTCLIDVLFPDAGLAAVELLEAADIEVIFPEKQSCCGQPPYSSGYMDQARAMAIHQALMCEALHPKVAIHGT